MSSQTERQLHEEFSVSEGEELRERPKVVRQDRYEVRSVDCSLLWRGEEYEVLNYSTFGIAIYAPTLPKQGSGPEEAEFQLEGVSVGHVQLRWVRSDHLGDEGHKVAFEIVGEPLNISRINAIVQSAQIVREHGAELGSFSEVPAGFRRKVYETKDMLEQLEQRLEMLQNTTQLGSNYEVQTFELAVSQVVSRYLQGFFDQSFAEISEIMGGLTEDRQKASLEFFRNKLRHLIYQAPFAERCVQKPLGYSGDFEMMNQLYRNEPLGKSLFSKCLNHYFLNHPYSKAVRNRADFLKGKIQTVLKARANSEPLKILSVACGPAREIQDLVKERKIPDGVEIHLLDQDLAALREAQRNIRAISRSVGSHPDIKYFHKAIKNLLTEKVLEEYDFIYSAGLFDYFSDNVARLAAKKMYRMLKAGGQLVIGNYKACSSSRMQMELVLDWYLIYRSESDLVRLYEGLSTQLGVESEPEGVNLFVSLKKP